VVVGPLFRSALRLAEQQRRTAQRRHRTRSRLRTAPTPTPAAAPAAAPVAGAATARPVAPTHPRASGLPQARQP
jgi:hypothetical protein